jgi:hypothetical protein
MPDTFAALLAHITLRGRHCTVTVGGFHWRYCAHHNTTCWADCKELAG